MTKREHRPLEGVHVLVVDDSEEARDILRDYLTYWGAVVSVAEDGNEALDALQRVRADVIVSDLWMPGLDGFELMKRVRALPGQAGRPTPAIAVTGLGGKEHRQRARASGYQVYLVKPIDPFFLVKEIERLLPPALDAPVNALHDSARGRPEAGPDYPPDPTN